ncbi:MAG: outer membrane lipoprotein-sorting protein [Verrucomicrobiales bacterium]|jgi:outer membrane lipoprotein-sorting protein
MNFLKPTIIISLAFAASATAADEDGSAIVERWLDAGSPVSALRVEFTQTRKLKTIKLPIVKKGTLWIDYAKDRFRWQTGDPPQTIVVRVADELTVIRTPGKKFERRDLGDNAGDAQPHALMALAGGFPRSVEAFNRDYRLIEANREGETFRLITQPLGARGKGVEHFIFLIDAEQHRLRGFEIQLEDGSSISTSFDAVETEPSLTDELFVPDLTNYRETQF